jgi:hypothetical protein
MEITQPYLDLATAVLRLASKDYVRASLRIRRGRPYPNDNYVVSEVRQFFRSGTHNIYCVNEIDGDYILRKLEEMIDERDI